MTVRYYFAVSLLVLTVLAKTGQWAWLEHHQVIRKIDTQQKIVALTFDDGPNPRTTPEILKILRDKQVKATFFVLGENVEAYPALVRQAAADGHEIASHSYTHRYLTKITPEECEAEIEKASQVIAQQVAAPTLFRPPGGLYNDNVIEAAQKRNYSVILWSVDTLDWQRPSPGTIVRTVVDELSPGGIVLLHDGLYPMPTPKALGNLIDRLRAKGYGFATISELRQYEEVKETGCF